MTRNIFFVLLIFLSCSQTSPQAIPSTFHTEQINYRGHSIDIVRLDLKDKAIRFYLADQTRNKYRSLSKLKSAVEKKGKTLRFAMNGGMYLKDGSPQGLYIEDKKQISPLDTIQKAFGNFYLQPNGVFCVSNETGQVMTSAEFIQSNYLPDYATQSGPMLVIHDTIHPVFVKGSKNLNIRNGVGIDTEGKVVFAISNNKLNLFDFAMLFKEKLNCKNALYLDGFVSKAYIPDLNRNELGGNFGVMIGVEE